MPTSWILVANSEKARVFEARKRNGDIREIKELTDPLAHHRNRDLVSDSPGSRSGGAIDARHGVAGERDAKEQEAIRFAKRIAETLSEGRVASNYQRLYLVADPSMLGWLRNALDSPTQALIAAEVDKNLVSQQAADIRKHLPDFL